MLLFQLFLLCVSISASAAEPARIILESNAAVTDLHPREDTLEVRVLIQDSSGRPVPRARLHLLLKAPDSPWIGSTDFPVVEGSRLLDQTVEWQGQAHTFRIVPPIRGTYTLTAAVSPLPGDASFASTTQTLPITIHESPARKKNLAVLLALLITAAGISGFVIGRGARVATLGALFLLCLVPPPSALAHGPGGHPRTAPLITEAQPSATGSHIELDILTPEPKVGELTELVARYQNADGQNQPAVFHVEIMQLEHQHIVFATDVPAADGILHWSGQFFDGSPHRIMLTAKAMTGGQSENLARLERDVAVTGVEPPLRSIVKSFGLLMLIASLALALGVSLGRARPLRKRRFA